MKNIFKNIFRKSNPVARAMTLFMPLGMGVAPKVDYAAQTKEGYAANITVYACVNMIASSIAGVSWCLYASDGKGEAAEVMAHPYLDLLARPNPLQGQSAFMQMLVAHLYISGNSYMQAVGPWAANQPMPASGQPQELYCLRPDRVRVLPDPVNLIGGYEYRAGGQAQNFPPQNILHLKLFNPLDDFYGLSPIQVGAMDIDKINQGNKWNVALLANSAVPSGALVSKDLLGDEQFRRLQNEILDKYSGAMNARRPLLLENGLDWKEFSMSPKDMDWTEGQKSAALQIANLYNVPGELISLISATHQNRNEARKVFYSDVVIPVLRNLRDEFNHWLSPRFGKNLYLDFNADEIPAMAEDRNAVWERAVKSDFLTINEKREMVGYDARPNGDVIYLPFNLMPMGESGAPPQPDPGTQPGKGILDSSSPPSQGGVAESRGGLTVAPLVKIINLPDASARRREIMLVIQLRKKFEIAMAARVRRQFQSDAYATASAFADGGKHAALSAVIGNQSDWYDLYYRSWFETMDFFGRRALSGLKSAPRAMLVKSATEDQFVANARAYAQRVAGQRITQVGQATKDKINELIDQALQDGLGMEEVQANIMEAYAGFGEYRANRIATTEILGAQNIGGLESMRALDVPGMSKGWLWSGVSRQDHAAVDGEQVGLDEQFIVGGVPMDSPGDPKAPPEQTIHCACSMSFALQ